jgi:hypothetical protein
MNGRHGLKSHNPQVKMAFSLEETPCGPTTSVGGSTGFFTVVLVSKEWICQNKKNRNILAS